MNNKSFIQNVGTVEVDSGYISFVFFWQILMTILLLFLLATLARVIWKIWKK